MISTTKVQAQVKQIQQFDAAVENFKTKYNYLPGDVPNYLSGYGKGDGNGIITTSANCLTSVAAPGAYGCELPSVWLELFPEQFTNTANGNYHGLPWTSQGSTPDVPEAKIGKKGAGVIVMTAANAVCSGIATPGDPNYYVIVSPTMGQTAVADFYTFTDDGSGSIQSASIQEMMALDKKIDDGIANAGNVKPGAFVCNRVTLGTGGACNGSGTYTNYPTNLSGNVCIPFIRIGAQAGDPQ